MATARGSFWSAEEVEATVNDYLRMLQLELSGQPYNKAAHNRGLQGLLNGRTAAAIELKHQNISAILLELGQTYIPGYKPRSNYQLLLRDVLVDRLRQDVDLDRVALQAVERDAVVPDIGSLKGVLVDAPRSREVRNPSTEPYTSRPPVRRDYLTIEAQNRSLGFAGERFVAEFEARRLHAAGQQALADKVEHVASTQGDGHGYDVLSFEPSGRERFIEVKTTAFGVLTPFYVTRNELRFSEANAGQFVLARVHEFRSAPKLFELKGAINKNLQLDPVSFVARF